MVPQARPARQTAPQPGPTRTDPPHTTVVVVSYNTRDRLRDCLASVPPDCQTIVVDNASTDGSAEMVRTEFPFVELIANRVNVGFGTANNQGMALARAAHTLFLNSDCIATQGAIAKLAALFEDERTLAVGGRLLHPDGRVQRSAARMLNLGHVFLEQTLLEKLVGGYWTTPEAEDRGVREVGQVMGACLMIRTGSIEFDEDFFLYCEDTDLLRRLRSQSQGKVLYHGDACFYHALGASSPGTSRWLAVARYNRGKELYFAKHSGPLGAGLCWLLNRFGAAIRLALWTAAAIGTVGAVGRFRSQAALWARVLTAPRAGPPRPDRSAGAPPPGGPRPLSGPD